jgi:DNA-binding NarL/FixJ family response regulator
VQRYEAVGSLRTVLVDDVEDLRALLRVLLAQDGRFDIVGEATNGEEAIDVVGRLQPDVVVLDLAMPIMDGLTALPALRKAAPNARIVVLSGLPIEDSGPAAVDAGAVGYIEKGRDIPSLADDIFDLASVLRLVEWVLDRQLPAEPLSASQAREAVTNALISDVSDTSLDTLVLLTSELVTNVVTHARSDCHLGVELFPDIVRVSVTDESGTPLQIRRADTESESGRGLALVEMLSSNWGVVNRRWGKTVWFEVPRRADRAS